MDKKAFLDEIEELKQREDYSGLIVKIEESEPKNWSILVEKYPEKLEEAQSLSSVQQRVKITLFQLEKLAEKYIEKHDIGVEIRANQKEVDRLRSRVLSNKDRLFDFNSATPFPSRCTFAVTKSFLKGCRDYLHTDWRAEFSDDLLRFEGQTLLLESQQGNLTK